MDDWSSPPLVGLSSPALGCSLEASVILNNTGVRLLEEKRYSQAAETLRDSLHLMNCAMKERQAQLLRAAMDIDDVASSHTTTATTKLVEPERVTSCLSQTTSSSRGNDMGRAAPLETPSSAALTRTSPVSVPTAHPVRIIQFSKSSKYVEITVI
jgi:hypothetical protein